MTTADLIAMFRLTIPAMDNVTDAELTSDFDVYGDYISKKRFGKLYAKALCYFVAHMRTLQDMIAASGGNGGDTALVAGTLTGERENELERRYSAGSSGASPSDDLLHKTIYGQMFLQLRDMVIVPATVRTGGWFVGACFGHRPRF